MTELSKTNLSTEIDAEVDVKTEAKAGTMPKLSSRHLAREFAVQGTYAWLVNHIKNEMSAVPTSAAHLCSVLEIYVRDADEENSFKHCDKKLFRHILAGVLEHATALQIVFTPHLDRTLTELSPVEHAILLVGTFELVHSIEVPKRVVINEAIELGKSFGGTDGHKFINGVLDRVAAVVRPHD